MNDNIVKEVKEKLDIVQEIGQRVNLNKRGQNYVGLCPFHNEKTPSFYVSPQKKMFHCFGCSESGDVLSFIMKYENLSFREVLIENARKYNIDVEFSKNQDYFDDIDSMRKSLSDIFVMYKQWIENDQNEASIYCRHRHITIDDIESFGLGYATKPDIQMAWLKKNKDKDGIKKTGLFNSDGYPLLHNRLIFPIHNSRGILIGFSGRILAKNNNEDIKNKAKYINSPESVTFSKKKVLYALHKAKKKIKKENKLIIVEGFTDAIFMHKNGFENTVAVMGTALTNFHANEIARLCKHVVLMFDSDSAGVNAIYNSLAPLQSQSLVIHIVQLDEKDPGDFFQKKQANDMQKCLSDSIHYMSFYLMLLLNKYDVKNPSEKSEFIVSICNILKNEKDDIIKEHYINEISEKAGVSKHIVESYLGSNQALRNKKTSLKSLEMESKYKKAEDFVLYYAVSNDEFRKKNMDCILEYVSILKNNEIKSLFLNSNLVDQEFIDQIRDSEIKNYLLSLVIKFTEYNFEFTLKRMEEYLDLLKKNEINKRIKSIKDTLKKNQTEEIEKNLLIELSSLIKKIK